MTGTIVPDVAYVSHLTLVTVPNPFHLLNAVVLDSVHLLSIVLTQSLQLLTLILLYVIQHLINLFCSWGRTHAPAAKTPFYTTAPGKYRGKIRRMFIERKINRRSNSLSNVYRSLMTFYRTILTHAESFQRTIIRCSRR